MILDLTVSCTRHGQPYRVQGESSVWEATWDSVTKLPDDMARPCDCPEWRILLEATEHAEANFDDLCRAAAGID